MSFAVSIARGSLHKAMPLVNARVGAIANFNGRAVARLEATRFAVPMPTQPKRDLCTPLLFTGAAMYIMTKDWETLGIFLFMAGVILNCDSE